MTELIRVKARWTGFTGAPGYTVLHFRDFGSGDGGGGAVTQEAAVAAATKVAQFFTAIRATLVTSARIQVEGEIDVIEDTTGELTRSLSVPAPAVISGTGGSAYSGPVGAVVNWRTGGIRKGRRIRGRSFLVPLTGAAFGADGQIITSMRDTIQAAATALADSTGTPDLGVYARPSSAGASDGTWAVATGAQVPTMAAVLRSRRD